MSFTPLQLALLCQLVYFDPPPALIPGVGTSLTAGTLARALALKPPCGPLSPAEVFALGQIETCRNLASLRVAAYINDNQTNGFVGYAFGGPAGQTLVGFRGSESTTACAPSNIDWLDNLRTPLKGSFQYPAVEALAKRFSPPRLFFGHSKGGHNALYALASQGRAGDQCVCFDAQGFAPGQLTRAQAARLGEQAVNYVQRLDVVGALLCHPEKRVFVKQAGQDHPHALTAMAYDLEGDPVPGRRPLRSAMIGLTSCLLALTLRRLGESSDSVSASNPLDASAAGP